MTTSSNHRRVRRASLGVAVVALLAAPAVAEARTAPAVSVRSITRASPFPVGCGVDHEASGIGLRTRDADVEPDIAVNPANPKNVIAVYSQDLYDGYVVQSSRDGGTTWREVVPPGITTCSGGDFELVADASVDIGPDGTAYLSSFALDAPAPDVALPHRTKLQVSTSRDGGLTWSQPVEVVGGALRMGDRPILTADPLRPGVAYVSAAEAQTVLGGVFSVGFARTDDGGRTWSAYRPIVAFDGAPNSNIIAVLPDGDLLLTTTVNSYANVVQPGAVAHRTVANRSTDGGLTWSAPIAVTTWTPTGQDGADTPFGDPETGEPVEAQEDNTSMAVARDGSVYVAGRNSTGDGASEIAVVKSSDGGLTWSPQSVVSSGPVQKWMPTIAVAGDGTVGLTYYDHRNDVLDDEGFTTDAWFASSRDGGRTWSERHLAGPFDLRTAVHRKIPLDGLFLGDYQGLVGVGDGFVAAFAMSRPTARAGASDVFFARVRLRR